MGHHFLALHITHKRLQVPVVFYDTVDTDEPRRQNSLLFVWLFNYRMCEGEKRKLVIPSDMGYGDKGAPPKIPGNITLNNNVAGELCKLARVTGPEFPHPLLSSRMLPASDWPVPRGAV